jgi:hypothetical protein
MSDEIYRIVDKDGNAITADCGDTKPKTAYRSLAAVRGIRSRLLREAERRLRYYTRYGEEVDRSKLPVYRIQVSEVSWKDVE